MTEEKKETVREYGFNTPQRLFIGYTLAILVDLTVLNFFDEYWSYVSIDSFTISLVAAVLLQILLKLAIGAEHRIATHYKKQKGTAAQVKRWGISYIILVGSKFVMLEAINIVFGDKVQFSGPLHGVIAFFAVIFAIIVAETIVAKIYFGLKDKN